MIRGVHTMFYSSEAEGLRAFLRDKLGLPYTDVGEGWLIFDLPEADMGVHPEDLEHGGHNGKQHISFYCDDIDQTVAELKGRGVEFTMPVADHGYGFVTMFKVPGGFDVQLYQPKYVKRTAPESEPAPAQAPKPAVAASAQTAKSAAPRKRRPARVKAAPAKKRPAARKTAKTRTAKSAKSAKARRRGR